MICGPPQEVLSDIYLDFMASASSRMLGTEARLGWISWAFVANLVLAGALFAEPMLFGRIVDTLANSQSKAAADLDWNRLLILLASWVGFALFSILAGTLISLHADRLSHRQYQVVRTTFFEHVLQQPLAYHTGAHSGRLVKVMVTGTNTLWSLWLAFFREHFVAFVSLLVLLPATLFVNWRYGLLLIALCCVFTVLIAFIISRSEKLQGKVERYYSDVSERTTDTLGNIALVQSFTRVESEVLGMKQLGAQALNAQLPVLAWWALATVITRTATTLTILAILVLGVWFYVHGTTTVGEIVMFMSYATLLIGKLEQAVSFSNHMVTDAPRLREFFDSSRHRTPAVRDRPGAARSRPGQRGLIEFDDVSHSYDGKRPAVHRPEFRRAARRDRRDGWRHGRRQVDGAGASASRLRSAIRRREDRRQGHSRSDPYRGCVEISAWSSRRCSCSSARWPRICASASPMPPKRK